MLICVCCATKKVHAQRAAISELELRKGADLLRLGRPVLEVNFGMERFRRLYGCGPPFAEDEDVQAREEQTMKGKCEAVGGCKRQ